VPYSLVGAATLGYDLARLPQGEQVAHVVRTALRCTTQDLEQLAHRHPGRTRDDRWEQVRATGSPGPMTTALPLADHALERAAAGDTASSSLLLQRLEQAVLGNVEALDRMIRCDVLDWTWLHSGDLSVQDPVAALAADVLVDAAASAFCSDSAARPLRRMMATPYLLARAALSGDDAGPTGHPGVDALLDRVSTADPRVRQTWRRAVDDLRPGTAGWAPAMHQATWALSVSDRLRLGTDAQMAAVGAFRSAGFTGRDAAHGVWNALSGAVAATAASDVLPAAQHDLLMKVWWRVRDDGVLDVTTP
jgi:hypothetical protein